MALKAVQAPVQVRKSIRRTQEDTRLVSQRRPSAWSYSSAVSMSVPEEGPIQEEEEEGRDDASYHEIVADANLSVGHGAMEGAFPEEWDAQLLVDCGHTHHGDRLVLFCPRFLAPFLDDVDELDRAFRFILLAMDGIAMHEKYIFVYCYLGMDWSDPRLAHRLRVAYDILPEEYAKNCKRFYILHPTSGFRVSMWTVWSWMSKSIWDKIEYVNNVDALCRHLHPGDPIAQAELHRRFPQMVQRRDAELVGAEAPVTFGVPLGQICNSFGVDFTDKTTGRWYPRLPPAVIFLCEAMEREAADDDFGSLFDADATSVYKVVKTVDEGLPLDRDIPMSALWCVFKLILDCLPEPLLSFRMIEELRYRNVGEADTEAHCKLLAEAFHHWLPKEEAYVALYSASCLHTLCENAREKQASTAKAQEIKGDKLTPASAAKVFGPSFVRPREMSEEQRQWLPVGRALVETLVRKAETPEFWIGSLASLSQGKADESSSDEGRGDG